MANNTPDLLISHIATNQNQKEATANTAFDELDSALTALLSKVFPLDADYTLTATEGGEAYGNMAFKFTGTISAIRNVIVPSTPKLYVVANNTTGGFSIVVKTATGTGITVSNGTGYAILYCDGTNVIQLTFPAGGTGIFQLLTGKDQPSGYAGLDASGFLQATEENLPIDARTTVTEAVNNADRGKLVTFNNVGAVAATIAQAGIGGLFAAGWYACLFNLGAGLVTLTPTISTVNGGANIKFSQYTGCLIYSDGTNYGVMRFGIVPTATILHQFVKAIAADGTGTLGQPAAADLSDGVTGTGAVTLNTVPTLEQGLKLHNAGGTVNQRLYNVILGANFYVLQALDDTGTYLRDLFYVSFAGVSHIPGSLKIGGSGDPTSVLDVVGLPIFANNAAAVAGGKTAGALYRTGADPDLVCVVH